MISGRDGTCWRISAKYRPKTVLLLLRTDHGFYEDLCDNDRDDHEQSTRGDT